MTPIGLFKGERALVTGSASNIGRAIALALAREGAAVRCVDIDAARNTAVVEEIVKAGGTAESVIVDLSTTDGWRAALPGVGQPIHLFVHSASPARRETDTALAVSEAVWDGMVNTNVRSGFFIARELARRIEGAEATIMEGLGHFPMSEDPARFLGYLRPVLASILKRDAKS